MRVSLLNQNFGGDMCKGFEFFHSLFFFEAIMFLSLHLLVTENQILFFVVVVVVTI
jgi:hypothetical protein